MEKVQHMITRLDVVIDENNIVNGAQRILDIIRPSWSREQVKFKVRTILLVILLVCFVDCCYVVILIVST